MPPLPPPHPPPVLLNPTAPIRNDQSLANAETKVSHLMIFYFNFEIAMVIQNLDKMHINLPF